MSIDAAAMIRKLQACAPYTNEPFPWRTRERVSLRRAETIRRYFKERAGLDLSSLADSGMTAWEKALTVSDFVSAHIPHDNQKEPLKQRDAISLWEYSLRVPTGFNCRWHAILLSELLLSMQIKNRFVTCFPEDRNDRDCHVVNLVWLPEKEKWAMIDSDMQEYYDEVETLLKNILRGFSVDRISHIGSTAIQGIWAKNIVDVLIEIPMSEIISDVAHEIEKNGFVKLTLYNEVKP